MKMLIQHVQRSRPRVTGERTEDSAELDEPVLACLNKDPRKCRAKRRGLFAMAWQCKTCEGWNQQSARTWWETHCRSCPAR
jgi:hypothetical protein